MRTTVDLPPTVHRRACEIAQQRHQSLSTVVAELAVRGLASLDEPVRIVTDPATGLPLISIGRPVSAADVTDRLDELIP